MLVFNNQQRCGFDEIAIYGPKFYLNVKEMVAIYKFAGYTLDLMAEDLERLMAYQFIEYMDAESLSRVETFLGITKKSKLTLLERRTIVKASFHSSGKMSKSKIISIVNSFVKSDCNVVLINSKVKITITMAIKENPEKYMSYIRNLIEKGIPAHLALEFYSRFQGDYNIQVSYENVIRFRTAFYPRYNLPRLYLDNIWPLDGSHRLSGYDSGESIDFYPVRSRFLAKVINPVRMIERLNMQTAVGESVTADDNVLRFRTGGKEEAKSAVGMIFQCETTGTVTAGQVGVMNKNVMDNNWKLGGERQLNGGLSIL